MGQGLESHLKPVALLPFARSAGVQSLFRCLMSHYRGQPHAGDWPSGPECQLQDSGGARTEEGQPWRPRFAVYTPDLHSGADGVLYSFG